MGLLTGKDYSNVSKDGKPSKSHFIVKIQLTDLHRCDDYFDRRAEDSIMLTYNKDKSLYGDIGIEENKAVKTELTNKIKEKGLNGYKGYFYAILKERTDQKKAKPAGGKRKEKIA